MGLRQLQIFGLVHGILKGTVTYRDVGHVLAMPFQMRLKHRPSRRSPALMFVATEHLDAIRTYELEGPADLVVEIVAAGAESRYWDEKCQEYAGAGVRELWRIDPAAQDVEAYALSSEGRFRAMPEMDGKIESTILRGFFVKPQWLSRESLPMITEALREMGVTL